MSSTRAEIFNPLTLPVLAGAALDGIVQKPYIAPTIWLIVTIVCLIMHIHYGMGVVSKILVTCVHFGNNTSFLTPTIQKIIRLIAQSRPLANF